MSRVIRAAALAVAMLCSVPATALAHQGNPNFRSQLRSVAPSIDGLELAVVNFDDSLRLTNRSGRAVVVVGYRGEPYVRIGAGGRVQINLDSPTHYLNEDRFAEGVDVPADASPKAPPRWRTVDRSGRYAWHDHRIHWMARTLPPQVEDEHERTEVFDWKVPLRVGGESVTAAGSLIWVGTPDDGFPMAAGISLGVVALLGAAAVVAVRRRRRRSSTRPPREAW